MALSRKVQSRIGLGVTGACLLVGLLFFVGLQPRSGRMAVPTTGAPVSIPIDVERDGADTAVIVPVMIGGKGPFHFLLDTGASTTAVNGTVLRAVHATDTGEQADYEIADGSVDRAHLFRVDEWRLGPVALEDRAIVSDIAHPLDEDGLLGSDQLARFGAVTIDYARERLVLTPRRSG